MVAVLSVAYFIGLASLTTLLNSEWNSELNPELNDFNFIPSIHSYAMV